MNRKLRIAFILCLSSWGLLQAQERMLARANQEYEEFSFQPAIDIYQRVLDKGYVSQDLLEKLGNSYYFNADYTNAARIYEQLVKDYGTEIGPEYYFRYGQTLKSLGEYDRSDMILARFANMTREDIRAQRFMRERDYRDEIAKNSGRYDVDPFEYNSPYSDFAPALYKQGLIFSSDRDTGNLARYRHTWTEKDFLDLYKLNADSVSNNRVVKVAGINSRLHESTSTVTKDGKTIYFTRNNFVDGDYRKDEKGVIRLKIFRAQWVDGAWANVTELPFNSDSYSVAHPTLSADGNTLYFASDMPGSLGDSDIFKVSINAGGTFGSPVNLGNNINTEARETFPHVTSADVLYFASDGHPGLGGLDIFATDISGADYLRRVVNVGEPVNGPMDDFTFIFAEETRKGYFASNRPGGKGSDDIYTFVETRPLVLECIQKISGTVRDRISSQPLSGATVMVLGEDNEEITRTLTDSEGEYQLTLDCDQGNFVRALREGYIPAEEYIARSDGKPQIIDFYLEREKVTAGYGDDLAKLLQLSTIYFDFDKYDIRPDAEVELQKVIAAMEKYPSLKIKANSHTDSRGPDAYNLWLSQKRAESTVNYMISKGISSDRLVSEGYGETRLINRCEDGVRCSKEEHQLNRRSEFIIYE